jgi:hypothetical protein
MHKNTLCVSFTLLAALFAQTPNADDCKPGAHAQTTPSERFAFESDGTVLDTTTGLTWMRCALGQRWQGGTCKGSAERYAWQDSDWAKDTTNLEKYAGHADWRVPVVPELASIVELGCADRRINTTVFPATPAAAFWSSMEKPGTEDYAYALDFGAGGAAPTLKSTHGVLRLVRGGPWWTPPKKNAAASP